MKKSFGFGKMRYALGEFPVRIGPQNIRVSDYLYEIRLVPGLYSRLGTAVLEICFEAGSGLVQDRCGGFGKGCIMLVIERINAELHESGREQV